VVAFARGADAATEAGTRAQAYAQARFRLERNADLLEELLLETVHAGREEQSG
jgi:hypothetical protein